jgi:hypothetical protein
MKDNHGLKCNNDSILECLSIMESTMNMVEAKAWLTQNQSVAHPVSRIPVDDGFGCSLCSYSAGKRTVLYNHISSAHRNATEANLIVERRVQKPFTSRLTEYIIVNSIDDEEPEDIPHWRATLNEKFNQTMNELSQSRDGGSTDLRLVNTFIAKIRYIIKEL